MAINGSNVVQWAALADASSTSYLSDNPLNVTVQMVTSSSGSGSIILQSPGNLTGSLGHVLDLTLLKVLASSNGNLSWHGLPYVYVVPNGSATLYTEAADLAADTTFNIFFGIDDTSLPVDTWSSSAFTIVATAT